MKIHLFIAFVLLTTAPTPWALTFNDSITAIFGAGNPDTGWTSDTNNNFELGLRGKNRDTGATPNDGAGTYTFALGTNVNWEFSINSDVAGAPGPSAGRSLLDYNFRLSIDTDPSAAQSFFPPFNPVTAYGDNSLGDNSTANGAGVETGPASSGIHNIAQNSQRIFFFPLSANQNANGTYDFLLAAYDLQDAAFERPLAQTAMRINIGEGGRAVPDSGTTLALFTLALAGMAAFGLRRSAAAF